MKNTETLVILYVKLVIIAGNFILVYFSNSLKCGCEAINNCSFCDDTAHRIYKYNYCICNNNYFDDGLNTLC